MYSFSDLLPDAFHRVLLIAGGIFGTVLNYIVGNHLESVGWLVGFMTLDFLLGTVCACKQGEWSSALCQKGLFKKFFILLIAFSGHGLDIITGLDFVMTAFISAFAFSEVGSCVETISAMGYESIIPIPIRSFIAEMKDKPIKK